MRFGDGITAVVRKSRYVAFIRGVYNFLRVQRHKIVMLVLIVAARATLELGHVQHFADVLDDKLSPGNEEQTLILLMTLPQKYEQQINKCRFIQHCTNALDAELSPGNQDQT